MRLTDFKVLTFDTYGTLIDWEEGIVQAAAPLVARLDSPPTREALLVLFGEEEAAQQAETPDMIYSDLLAAVCRRMAKRLGTTASDGEATAFGASVGDWPAFTDSREALAYLKQHYKMVTLTNCDRASYAGSDRRLGAPWDAVYTAQDIGSYKPAPRNFDYMLKHLQSDFGLAKGDVLHTAQSLFHDHVQATALGLATAWIDRHRDSGTHGATARPSEPYRIDFHFGSMAEMVEAHKAELAGG